MLRALVATEAAEQEGEARGQSKAPQTPCLPAGVLKTDSRKAHSVPGAPVRILWHLTTRVLLSDLPHLHKGVNRKAAAKQPAFYNLHVLSSLEPVTS